MKAGILKDIARLGWPVLVGQLAVMLNGVVDTVMAGRLGAEDLAAVGIGSSIFFSIFVTLMGVLIALTPVVAQLHGARRLAEAGEEVRQGLWLGAALAGGAFVLIYAPDPLIAFAGPDPAVGAKVRAYLRALAFGVPAMMAFRVFYAFTTAVSRPRVVMLLNLGSLALKIPLNYVFIHGALGAPALGGPGCGVASAIAAWVIAAAALAVWLRDPAYRPYGVFAKWSPPRWSEMRRLAQIGLPIGFNFLVDVTSFTFMALFIARLGAASSAGHQVAANVTAVAYMLPLAMSSATSVLVGQAIGAGDAARARLTGIAGIGSGLACGCAVALAVWLARGSIARLYTEDAAVAALAATLLGWVAVYHLFDAVSAVAVSALRGYKKTVVPMLCNLGALWGLGLGGGYALAFGPVAQLGAAGFWIGGVAGVLAGAAMIVAYFLRVSRA
jgi:MATE family multidrug resistance protein